MIPKKPDVIKFVGLFFDYLQLQRISILHIVLFFAGFSSIISQILLIRNFLISYYGNELSIGIILTSWLCWTGIGSLLGNAILKKNGVILFPIFFSATPIILFLQIIAVKFSRIVSQTSTGEFMSMGELFLFSFLILSIGCILWGIIYTFGAKYLSATHSQQSVNTAYILESFGSAVGGLLFSFVLASQMSTLQVVLIITAITWCIAVAIKNSLTYRVKKILVLCITGSSLLSLPWLRFFEHNIETLQWRFINEGLTFIRSIDTEYQNLSLLKLDNQFTIFSDGRPIYNIPNTYDAELFTHSIMVHKLSAKRVCIIGSGFNGIIKEVLKYPVQRIDYIEIDPTLIDFARPILDSGNQQALINERVSIIIDDSRNYLKEIEQNYDVILLNVGEPSTANLNRFYTLEWYKQCSLRLTTGGIMAITFPSSSEYISDEMKEFNVSIYQTFTKVFHNSLLIPGMHALLIGSTDTVQFITQPDSLASRFQHSGIRSEYFSKYTYDDLMLPERRTSITQTLASARQGQLNTDLNPNTYYFDLLLWNRYLQGNTTILSAIKNYHVYSICCILVGGFFLLLSLHRSNPKKQTQLSLTTIMFAGGIIGMALNILLLLNFQETFGSLFKMIGAMTSANILGLALGTILAGKMSRTLSFYAQVLSSSILLVIIILFLPWLLQFLLWARIILLTILTTTLTGVCVGLLFGVVNRAYLEHSNAMGHIYAFDEFGAAISALMISSIILPVLGIGNTSVVLFLLFLPAMAAIAFLRWKESR
jgi:spermidine synthase